MSGDFPSLQAAVTAAEELCESFGYTLPDGGIGMIPAGETSTVPLWGDEEERFIGTVQREHTLFTTVPLWGDDGEKWLELTIVKTAPDNYHAVLWIE